MSRPNSAYLARVARFSRPGITPGLGVIGSLGLRPPQIRKSTPQRPAFDLPIAELDMLDDRVGDHVAFGVGQRPAALANLESQREAHVTAQFFGDGRSPFGHCAIENGTRTEVNRSSGRQNYARFRQFFSVLISRDVPMDGGVLASFNPSWPLLNLRVARFRYPLLQTSYAYFRGLQLADGVTGNG